MKEQTRNTEVQINEEIGKLPEKEFRIIIVNSKDDQKPWKQNGENVRINEQRPGRIKEYIYRDKQHNYWN